MVLRVLIVDDNPEFLATASRVLERDGFDVVGVASTGAEALRSSKLHEPDVILVDIDLDGESGFDVAERLSPATDRQAVILISAYDKQDLEELIETSSAIGFVSKAQLSAEMIVEVLGGRTSRPN